MSEQVKELYAALEATLAAIRAQRKGRKNERD